MRTIEISVTDTAVTLPENKCIGRVGEHNATKLIIHLPELMVTGMDFHAITFETGFGAVDSDIITNDTANNIYIDGNDINCTLWQELTVSTELSFTVEAYKVLNNEPVMIAKSPLVTGLTFALAVEEGSEADTDGFSLKSKVREHELLKHTHANMSLLDSYTQTEQALSDSVSKAHTHSNIEFLNALTDAHDETKADKVTSPAADAIAGLDNCGNLIDSGFTPASFVKKLVLNGNGKYNESAALNSIVAEGVYELEYTDTEGNEKTYYTLRVLTDGDETVQYVDNAETVRRRSCASGVWSNWVLSKFIRQSPSNTPIEGHIPIYGAVSAHCNDMIIDSGRSIYDLVVSEQGKALSTNDFTDSLKLKLESAEMNSQENTVESVNVNSVSLEISDKSVNIPMHFVTADSYSDLPTGLPKGARAYVRNDGELLTFKQYSSLVFNENTENVDIPITDDVLSVQLCNFAAGATGDSISVGTMSDSVTGVPVVVINVTVGENSYLYITRSIVASTNVTLAKGWYNTSDDSATAAPTISNFNLVRVVVGETSYTSGDTVPVDALRLISLIVNESADEMHLSGNYEHDGIGWAYQRTENTVSRFTGLLEAGHKYFTKLNSDMTFTLPDIASLDLSVDNTILIYAEIGSSDIDVSFDGGETEILWYSGDIPTTTANTVLDLVLTVHPTAQQWQVGTIYGEAVTA